MNSEKRPGKSGWALFWTALVVVTLILFDWEWVRAPLSRYLSTPLGRDVQIAGDMRVDLSLRPLLVIDQIAVGNAPWSNERVMLRAQRLSLRVDPVSLWKSPVALSEVTLVRPEVLLERNAD